jgi:hypothetical protein
VGGEQAGLPSGYGRTRRRRTAGWVLIPVDECGECGAHGRGVERQYRAAQQQGLPGEDGQHRQVLEIADVTVLLG